MPQTAGTWTTVDYAQEALRSICHIYVERLFASIGQECHTYPQLAAGRSDEALAAVSRAVTVFMHAWQPVSGLRTHVLSQLDRLRQLTPGWDGYRAPAIDARIIDAAVALVNRLPDDIAPAPQVVPLATAGLQFEWTSGQASLELEFESPTTIRYLKWNPLEGEPEEDILDVQNDEGIKALIQWYARRHV